MSTVKPGNNTCTVEITYTRDFDIGYYAGAQRVLQIGIVRRMHLLTEWPVNGEFLAKSSVIRVDAASPK